MCSFMEENAGEYYLLENINMFSIFETYANKGNVMQFMSRKWPYIRVTEFSLIRSGNGKTGTSQ